MNLEEQRNISISLILDAFKIKNEGPKKLAEFISKNRTYFPSITDEYLNELKSCSSKNQITL